ncbi:p53-like transcription factor [Viridothelium virens]|uniref:p53-like transcription factor n=1 Tax=Viridothelium virens TaxID=1048519 RepID=A0A6A6HF50_VIRVR|nr:p53-like transcription factor [Viridothelium virens]
MEGFDTITMSYLTNNPMSLSGATTADQLSASLLPHDMADHLSNFDAETFPGSDDNFGPPPIPPHTPGLKRFSSTYEDPFSDVLSTYDQPLQPEQNGTESESIDRDNKLLSFSVPTLHYRLLDYALRPTSITLSAQLHGMFFLAESPWAASGETAAPPTELTCYRRNLFQITGTITLPRMLRFIMTEQGEQIPIIAQELSISATESVEGNSVKIISVPWKTPATNQPVVEDKAEKEPSAILLDLINGQEMDSEFVSFPIAWKRLQFRIATANNGRRKELQQHFVVRLKVVATLATGIKVLIAESQSGAIIVRGRSPRNFQSRKDFPLSAGGSTSRKNMHLPTAPTRTPTNDSLPQLTPDRIKNNGPTSNPFPNGNTDLQISPDFFEWKIPTGQTGAMTAIPQDPTSYALATPNAYAQSSPDLSRHSHHGSRSVTAPINLSLTDDEPKPKSSASPSNSNNDGQPRKLPKLNSVPPPPRASSFSLNMISSPDESADLLYEYFPLGLDDWMPPVDAVYRPHVVHQLNLPPDPKAQAVKNRSKRYFSEDQGPDR